jgi:alpha-D-xyloside xylohydrolase
MGDMAKYAEDKGYDLIAKRWKDSDQVLMDFTNPEAVKWWGENGPGKLARMGIKGYKLDRADGEKLMDTIGYISANGKTYRENYNDYPVQYVKATYEAVQPVLGDDFILFPRAQFTGSAKYGGMWSGDPNGRPEGLRSVIIGMQRCAVMGYPMWASDIGGYWGDFSRETCMRWIAFGCFSPLMETGPTNNRGFWSNPDEPNYDVELLATWRLYSKVRMELIPYIAALAAEAHESGTPVARPLFLVYPNLPEAWVNWETYLLGNDILVTPIWEKEKESQVVYLPEGELWINAWNPDQIFHGGQSVEVETPLHKIPLFIREGSGIKLGDLNALFEESLEKIAVAPDLIELEKAEGWR